MESKLGENKLGDIYHLYSYCALPRLWLVFCGGNHSCIKFLVLLEMNSYMADDHGANPLSTHLAKVFANSGTEHQMRVEREKGKTGY